MPHPQAQSKSALHTLPSFAQAFNSISNDDNAALPPIRTHSSPQLRPGSVHPHSAAGYPADRRHSQATAAARSNLRKRSRPASRNDDGYSSSELSHSPPTRVSFVKEEEYDQLEPSPPPPVKSHYRGPASPRYDHGSFAAQGGAPPPSLIRPHQSSKRRRVTISGVAHPLNTNLGPINTAQNEVHTPSQTTGHPHPHGATITAPPTTPISPVVMGFTIQKDDPQAIEQVKAMLGVRQRQKALIESRRSSGAGLSPITDGRKGSFAGPPDGRRGSIAGPAAAQAPSLAVNIVNPTPTSAMPPGSLLSGPKRPGNSPKAGLRRGPTPSSLSSLPMSSTSGPSTSIVSPRAKPMMTSVSASNIMTSGPGQAPRMISPPPPPIPSQSSRPHPHRSPPSMHNAEPPMQPRATLPPTTSQPQPQASQAQLATQGLTALANALPPPPNSFARRRAYQLGTRGKPADIMISPRDGPGTYGDGYKSLQPVIQSAPPVPRPGQQAGRFPMALPSLPPVGQRGVAVRKSAGQVPPTPTRLGTQRIQQGPGAASASNVKSGASHLSPASIAISSTVNAHTHGGLPPLPATPSTPATLHRAAHTSADKTAFLAPFEQFYDALSDARVLKGWFGEQLTRVGRVTRETEEQRRELERQKAEFERLLRGDVLKDTVKALVDEAVEREVKVWRDEVVWLRSRVDELEEGRAVNEAGGGSTRNVHFNERSREVRTSLNSAHDRAQSYPIPPGMETYSFPPGQTMNSRTGPLHGLARPESLPRSEASSPGPSFESGRRLSVSATRYEPPPHPQNESQSSSTLKHRKATALNGSSLDKAGTRVPEEKMQEDTEKIQCNGTVGGKSANGNNVDDAAGARHSPKGSSPDTTSQQRAPMDTT